jgi:hypothetical protein
MPTISVRITDEERKKLLRYGPLSETVREALELYMRNKKSREFVQKLRQFQQENPVKVDPDEIVRTIREGRKH